MQRNTSWSRSIFGNLVGEAGFDSLPRYSGGDQRQNMNSETRVKFWYSEAIDRVRATADPGGDAFDIEEAKELRDELDSAIQEAKEAANV